MAFWMSMACIPYRLNRVCSLFESSLTSSLNAIERPAFHSHCFLISSQSETGRYGYSPCDLLKESTHRRIRPANRKASPLKEPAFPQYGAISFVYHVRIPSASATTRKSETIKIHCETEKVRRMLISFNGSPEEGERNPGEGKRQCQTDLLQFL